MEQFRVIYNDQEILSIDKNEGIAYTSDKVIIGDLKSCKDALDKLLVDTSKINEYEYQDPLNYKYFLIPTDFITYIKHYSGFVKKAYPDLAFNLILTSDDIVVEGETMRIVTNTVSVIPCSVTHWSEDGLMVLESVIGSWNNQNTTKTINVPYKFESYNDLIAFRNANT